VSECKTTIDAVFPLAFIWLFFVTNVKFDAAIMILIIIDNVVLSLEHYRMSAAFETNVGLARLLILILFIVEMLLKLVTWRNYFFSSWWNWLDIFVVATGITGINK